MFVLQVLNLSKHLLLQIATPEAIVRLKHSDLAHVKGEVEQIYFEQQCHHSVEAFFNRYMKETYWEDGALMQVMMQEHIMLITLGQCDDSGHDFPNRRAVPLFN